MEKTKYRNQLIKSESDLEDASFIYDVFVAIDKQKSNKKKTGVMNRIGRLAIQNIWQEPRLPVESVGEYKKLRIKPFVFPWTPKAKMAYISSNSGAELQLEHIKPMNVYVHEVKEKIGKEINCKEEMLQYLYTSHEGLCFAVIEKSEHKELSNQYDPNEEFSRYEAIGIDLTDCKSIYEDGFKLKANKKIDD